jgi:glycosyltransferase involved in cell wall biosynthesis
MAGSRKDGYVSHRPDLHLIFLFPQVWSPQKENFAGRFHLLSSFAHGDIFAPTGKYRHGDAFGRFRIFSEPLRGSLGSVLVRLKLHILLPLRSHRRGSVDAVIAYDPYASGLNGVLLKWLLRTRLVIELNGDYHQHPPGTNPLKRWLMQRLFLFSLRRADAVKVLNRSQEEYVRRSLPGKPVFRFCDFVADHFFASLEAYDGGYFLSVGYPFASKGVGELVQAFRKLAAVHPDAALRIMGHSDEKERDHYRRLAGDAGRLEFVPPGWIEDVGEQVRGCLALVNAAHFEAMGRVHLEAMACSKPVIATRTNGARDYIVDGVTGLLCEIRNPEDLAAKLKLVWEDRKLAERLGRAGRELLEREHGGQRYTEQLLEMLDAVVRPSGTEKVPGGAASAPSQ